MRLVFFGTGAFGLPTLRAIAAQPEIELCGIVTGPDKPQGRGRKIAPTPISEWAAAKGFQPVWKPARLGAPAFAALLRGAGADVFVVVAYRILPETVFTVAPHAINLHASLLPLYRGAAPIQRALMAGETRTGVTTFLLQRTVDTGGILLQRETNIGPEENAGELAERLSHIGAEVVVETLRMLAGGIAKPRQQDDTLTSPAPKILPADRRLDLGEPGGACVNRVRALAPTPGAVGVFRGRMVKVLALVDAGPKEGPFSPGDVIDANPRARLIVASSDRALEIKSIQPEGKSPQSGAEFVRGYRVVKGERFEAADLESLRA